MEEEEEEVVVKNIKKKKREREREREKRRNGEIFTTRRSPHLWGKLYHLRKGSMEGPLGEGKEEERPCLS